MSDTVPLRSFRFLLELDGKEIASFSEVSGLSSEDEVIIYREGAHIASGLRELPGL